MESSTFAVSLSWKGKNVLLEDMSTETTGKELFSQARRAYGWQDDDEVKLLYKGKKVQDSSEELVFENMKKTKIPKIIVMATTSSTVAHVANQKSDPLIRGLDDELERDNNIHNSKNLQSSFWGDNDNTQQHKSYKFCRLEACTWQSFGHRPSEQTPHDFEAHRLLHRLATDPGIVAIMTQRELVVNTLGEMDPIDDRIMQKKQNETNGHAFVLGYNTNRGLRIDLKLRTNDLKDFRPYPELVSTLIHELSHNWVSDHNLVFWLNYAQMRVEYMLHHLYHSDRLVNGRTWASLAGLTNFSKMKTNKDIFHMVMQELEGDMMQHGLRPTMIQEPIWKQCEELDKSYAKAKAEQRRLNSSSRGDDGGMIGGDEEGSKVESGTDGIKLGSGSEQEPSSSARERALAAAERRRREQK